MEARTGVLLLNLGTPDSPSVKDVRRYLGEFLMDGLVIDIPLVPRFLLVHGMILRTRPPKSAEAYEKIWGPEGSPLLVHHLALTRKVSSLLGPGYQVEAGMRYGNPSIRAALSAFRQSGVREIVVFPLYPQNAGATTESSVKKTIEEHRRLGWKTPLRFLPPFYSDPGFLEPMAGNIRESAGEMRPDHLLFSFHGLPENQVKKADKPGGHCLGSEDCCARIGPENRDCYRAQSFETARLLAARAGVKNWSVGFQSRLGKTPWIRPYTEDALRNLAESGVKRLLVACPSFVADCLETLEEIAIRGKESFVSYGGEDLRLVPSLNSGDDWAEAVAGMVTHPGRQ